MGNPQRKILPSPVSFTLPAAEPHAGLPLGNGLFGALVWGGGQQVQVTINRQDYWQRGHVRWQPGVTWSRICELNQQGCRERFLDDLICNQRPGSPAPTRLPMGRFELTLDHPLADAVLDLATGEARMDGLRAVIPRGEAVCVLHAPGAQVRALPNTSASVEHWRKQYGMPDPESFAEPGWCGWVQHGADQPTMCAGCLQRGEDLVMVSVYGDSLDDARAKARALAAAQPPYREAAQAVARFYRGWWDQIAAVQLPDDRDSEILYQLGMYKLSGVTAPGAPAATLQGPWVEDDAMPPWSCDYHFNVNVQMCHWPMLPGNVPDWYQPLFAQMQDWMPQLRENARLHVGIDDGIMIPHAVDAEGFTAGGVWDHQLDHGCGAWTALLCYDHYRYTGDREALQAVGWPLVRGALRVYQQQLLREGATWRLPWGCSPEYTTRHGAYWGADPSFHLALIHALIRAAEQIVRDLACDEPELAQWREIAAGLPRYTLAEQAPEPWLQRPIALWEGQDLDESHRHHSHLAGLHPFDVLDPEGTDAEVLHSAIYKWIATGMGQWSGWCVPWAAMLHARLGDGEAAIDKLDVYRRFFTGPNYASRHDAVRNGFTTLVGNPRIMQIDAALGAAAAILEMLAHERGGVVRLAPAVPERWRNIVVQDLRLPGGRLFSGERVDGEWIRQDVEEPTLAGA